MMGRRPGESVRPAVFRAILVASACLFLVACQTPHASYYRADRDPETGQMVITTCEHIETAGKVQATFASGASCEPMGNGIKDLAARIWNGIKGGAEAYRNVQEGQFWGEADAGDLADQTYITITQEPEAQRAEAEAQEKLRKHMEKMLGL